MGAAETECGGMCGAAKAGPGQVWGSRDTAQVASGPPGRGAAVDQCRHTAGGWTSGGGGSVWVSGSRGPRALAHPEALAVQPPLHRL